MPKSVHCQIAYLANIKLQIIVFSLNISAVQQQRKSFTGHGMKLIFASISRFIMYTRQGKVLRKLLKKHLYFYLANTIFSRS